MSIQTAGSEWELPEFHMNAGETKFLRLPIYNASNQLIDAQGMTGRLSIADYVNHGACRYYVDCEAAYDSQSGGYVFTAKLQPEATIDLAGKFIYQLTVHDTYDDSYGVLRGVVIIGHNVDKSAVL